MSKKFLYLIVVIACLVLSSFKQVCDGSDSDEATVVKELPQNVYPANAKEELNFSPISNLLKI